MNDDVTSDEVIEKRISFITNICTAVVQKELEQK